MPYVIDVIVINFFPCLKHGSFPQRTYRKNIYTALGIVWRVGIIFKVKFRVEHQKIQELKKKSSKHL